MQDFYVKFYITRTFLSEQECDLVTVLVCINLTLHLTKSGSVHVIAFRNCYS